MGIGLIVWIVCLCILDYRVGLVSTHFNLGLRIALTCARVINSWTKGALACLCVKMTVSGMQVA